MKLGSWAESSLGINEQSVPQILEYFSLATEHDKHWYKAWHMWALMNYEAVLFYKQKDHAAGSSQNQEVNLPITPRPDTVRTLNFSIIFTTLPASSAEDKSMLIFCSLNKFLDFS